MTAAEPNRQLLLDALNRRERLRRIALWVILLLLILPAGAAIWLLTARPPDPTIAPVVVKDPSVVEVRSEIAKVKQAMVEHAQAREAERAVVLAAQNQTQRSLNATQTSVARLENLTLAQSKAVDSQKSMLEATASRDAMLANKVSEIASRSDRSSDELRAAMADLRNSLVNVEKTTASLAHDATMNRDSLGPIRAGQNEIAARLQSIQNASANMNAALIAIDLRVGKLEAEVAEMRKPSWFGRMLARINGKSEK